MQDRYKREIEYLRISVTDRCNLRCLYCMPSQGVDALSHDDILRYEQIEKIVRAMASLGIKKVRLTGGEPLVRCNLPHLVKKIKKIAGIEGVFLTTNGVLLEENLPALCAAGLDGINLSLDALSGDVFGQIARRDALKAVKRSLEKMLSYPQLKLKINCVPLAGINEQELGKIAALARDYPLEVRFIELMPIGCAYESGCRGLGEKELRKRLEAQFGPLEAMPENKKIGGPARLFSLSGFCGKIGFIDALGHKFCQKCNRVRLTADGFLKLCLNSSRGVDVKALLSDYPQEEALAKALAAAIYEKPQEHFFFADKNKNRETRKMFQIGG